MIIRTSNKISKEVSRSANFLIISTTPKSFKTFLRELFFKVAVSASLIFLTSCIGVGVFHKSEAICMYEEAWLTSETMWGTRVPVGKPTSFVIRCPETKDHSLYISKTEKGEFIKRRPNPERIEKISDDEEKIVYKKGLGWSGVALMLGVPIYTAPH